MDSSKQSFAVVYREKLLGSVCVFAGDQNLRNVGGSRISEGDLFRKSLEFNERTFLSVIVFSLVETGDISS